MSRSPAVRSAAAWVAATLLVGALLACRDDSSTLTSPALPGRPAARALSTTGFPLTQLQLLSGGADASAYGVNTGGLIVGQAGSPGCNCAHAVYWTTDGSVHDLGTFQGVGAGLSAVNDNGVAVGWAVMTAGGPRRAAIWSLAAGGNLLPQPTSWSDCVANAISPSGIPVGECNTGTAGRRAVMWPTGGGQPVSLGALPSTNRSSSATGIDSHGTIVGNSIYQNGPGIAFIERTGGVMQRMFPTASGAETITARGISPTANYVTGGDAINGDTTAYVWDEIKSPRLLGAPPGASQSVGVAVSDRKWVVGHAAGPDAGVFCTAPPFTCYSHPAIAFLWRPNIGIYTLGTIQGSLPFPYFATAVAGNFVAGYTVNRALLWTIP